MNFEYKISVAKSTSCQVFKFIPPAFVSLVHFAL